MSLPMAGGVVKMIFKGPFQPSQKEKYILKLSFTL